MAAYLVTHSLLSSWLHLIRENPYEDLTTEATRWRSSCWYCAESLRPGRRSCRTASTLRTS